MRESTYPWVSDATQSVSVNLYDVDMSTNFAVVEDEPGSTVVKNVSAQAPIGLEELVTFRYGQIEKVSTQLEGIYPRTTRKGYQFVVKDEYILRSTDEKTGVINDDPVVVYFTARTTKGANIISGEQFADAFLHLASFLLDVDTTTGKLTVNQATLDRLMRGATKPAELV